MSIFLRLLARLPYPLAYVLAWPLGVLLYTLPGRQRYYARTNIRLCLPELGARQQARLARRSLVNTVRVLLESLLVWLGPAGRVRRLVRVVEGRELLTEAVERGRGVILICPHLGNWEVAGSWLAERYPLTNMYRKQRDPELDRIIRQGRARFGAKLVPATNQGLRELLRTLQRGEIIGTLPDQNPGAGTGVFVPFFGINTYTPVFAARLAARTGATVLNICAVRLPRARGFRLLVRPANEAIHDPDIETAATAMNRDIEAMIRTIPEQYWWSYNRFRTRPEGEAPIYER
jgi:KDO2-lipid IV(A) lauroyltransferase